VKTVNLVAAFLLAALLPAWGERVAVVRPGAGIPAGRWLHSFRGDATETVKAAVLRAYDYPANQAEAYLRVEYPGGMSCTRNASLEELLGEENDLSYTRFALVNQVALVATLPSYTLYVATSEGLVFADVRQADPVFLRDPFFGRQAISGVVKDARFVTVLTKDNRLFRRPWAGGNWEFLGRVSAPGLTWLVVNPANGDLYLQGFGISGYDFGAGEQATQRLDYQPFPVTLRVRAWYVQGGYGHPPVEQVEAERLAFTADGGRYLTAAGDGALIHTPAWGVHPVPVEDGEYGSYVYGEPVAAKNFVYISNRRTRGYVVLDGRKATLIPPGDFGFTKGWAAAFGDTVAFTDTDYARVWEIAVEDRVTPPMLKGDVNGDGRVSLSDAIGVLRVAMGLDAFGGPVTPERMARADVNGDGYVSLADAILTLRLYVLGHE
jgi:hypothetical protein